MRRIWSHLPAILRPSRDPRWPLLSVTISLALALVGSMAVIGERARLVHVLAIFAGGLGSGAGLARTLDQVRGRLTSGR